MQSRFGHLLLVLVMLILGGLAMGLLGVFTHDAEPDSREELASGRGEEDPVLVGAGTAAPAPAVNVYATETDLAKLVPAMWAGNEAQARILELAGSRTDLVAELVEWMRPERDADRRAILNPGAQYSGPQAWGLPALFDTLARLAPVSVRALIAALEDGDSEMRTRVARCLGAMGKVAAEAVDALVARLEPGKEDVAGQAVMLRALGTIGVPTEDVLATFHAYLRDPSRPDDARAAAAEGFLGLTGATEAAFESCRVALQDQSFEVCTRLVPAIGDLGADAAPLIPDLLAIVQDPTSHEQVRRSAIAALGAVGVPNSRLVMALVDVAMDEQNEDGYRGSALLSLLSLGTDAQDAVFDYLESAEDQTRLLGVSWLVEAQAASRRVAHRLLGILDLLRSSDVHADRMMAIGYGRRAQVESGTLVSWLARWLSDSDETTRNYVLTRMVGIPDASGAVVRQYLEALDDESEGVRRAAVGLLAARAGGEYGDGEALRSAETVGAVVGLLEDPDSGMRLQAAMFVASAAPERAAEAMPVFIEILESGRGTWRALAPLHALGPRAREAIPALEKAIAAEKNEYLRRALEGTLAAVKGE